MVLDFEVKQKNIRAIDTFLEMMYYTMSVSDTGYWKKQTGR